MATPTLEAYRQLNPHLAGQSDDELLDQLSSQLQAEGTLNQYPDVVQALAAKDRAYKLAHTNPLKEFTRAAIGGVDTAQAQAYSALGQVGDFLTVPEVKNFGIEGYQRNIQESAENQPTIGSVSDVHSPKEALYYGLGLVGSQAAPIAEALGASAAGSMMGGAIGPEGIVGGALSGLGSAMGAKRAIDAARLGGSVAGLAGAGYVQSQNYGQLAQSGGEDAAITSAGVGALGGLLMTIVPSKVLRTWFGAATPDVAEATVTQLLDRAEKITPGLTESILHQVGEHGANNALLGVAQELTNMAGEMYSHRNNPSFEISDKELTDRILNGAVAGGALGAAFGALGGLKEPALKESERQAAQTRAQQIQQQIMDRGRAFAQTEGDTTSQYAPFAELFADQEDQAKKDEAKQRYHEARTAAFYTSDRAKELLRNELSRQAGGTEIKPAQMTGELRPETETQQGAEETGGGKQWSLDVASGIENLARPGMVVRLLDSFNAPEGSQSWYTLKYNYERFTGEEMTKRPTRDELREAISKQIGKPSKTWEDLAKNIQEVAPEAADVVKKLSTEAQIKRATDFVAGLGEDKKNEIRDSLRGLTGQEVYTKAVSLDISPSVLGTLLKNPELLGEKSKPEPVDYQYTYQPEQQIGGHTIPGYLQIDTFDKKGNNIGSSSLEDARKSNPDLPDVPEGLPAGRYSAEQIRKYSSGDLGDFNLPEKPEHGGDLPAEPVLATKRIVIPDTLPQVRSGLTRIETGSAPDEIEKAGRKGIRKDESTKESTKRLVAVKDNDTDRVTLMPVYTSTRGKLRVDNGTEPKITSRQALAEAAGIPREELRRRERYGGLDIAQIDQVLNETQSGAKPDEFLENIAKDPNRTVIGFVDMVEPAARRHFTFNSEDQFRTEMGVAENNLKDKGTKGGSFGVPQILEHLTDMSPEDSRGVQLLASFLESAPEAQALSGSVDTLGLRRNASNIIQRLLNTSIRPEVFTEKILAIKDPQGFMSVRKGKLFGLFTQDQWKQFKELIATKDTSPEAIQELIDKAIKESGWTSRMAFFNSIVPGEGGSRLGQSTDTLERGAAKDILEDDNLSAQVVEASGREGSTAMMQAAENALSEENQEPRDFGPEKSTEQSISDVPEAALGVAGLSRIEIEAIARRMGAESGEDARASRNILEARAESEISNPADDLEFQAVKGDLAGIVKRIFEHSREVMPELSDDFLYGIYSNLDKISRDSRPLPDTYRVVNDVVRSAFTNTVSWLAGRGVDVRLVQKSVDSQIEFLRNEWGRSISYEDGRRIVLLTMQDVTVPSRENLRVLFHEVAHQLFADEPVWVQRLTHEAVERLSDLQLDVFSKTYDTRLQNRELGPRELMEEVLAEHLAFQGVEAKQARSLSQRLLDGIKKAFYRAMLSISQAAGWNPSPHWAVNYMELRFKDMLDKVVTPRADFELMTGTEPKVARYKAMLVSDSKYSVERFQNGQFRLSDVADVSALASELNLDNKLSFDDVVIRDNRAEVKKEIWEREFGVGDKPSSLKDVLKKIVDHPQVTEPELKAAALSILDRAQHLELEKIVNRVTAEHNDIFREYEKSMPAPAIYNAAGHEIIVDVDRLVPLDHNGYAYLVLHEAVHAATSNALFNYEWFKEELQYLREDGFKKKRAKEVATTILRANDYSPDISSRDRLKNLEATKAALPHFEKLDRIFEHLKKEGFAPHAYGMKNLHEFVSEAITNRVFQMQLAKVKLPERMRIKREKQNVFATVVELVSRLFNADKKGNALESVTTGIEKAMLVAGPLSRESPRLYSFNPEAPPVSQIESDQRVKQDFEYEYATLNSQADFYHSLFDKAAEQAKLPFADYIKKILGIYNPEKSLANLQTRQQGLGRDLGINNQLRLNSSKGSENQVRAETDRGQITRRVLATVSSAQGKMAGKIAQLRDAIPIYRKELETAQNKFVRFETALHDVTTLRDNALKILRKGLKGAERGAERLVRWSTRYDGLPGVAAELFGVADETAIPDDYVDLMMDSVDEHQSDFFITDALTAATKAGIDFDRLSPTEIKQEIERVVRTANDARLIPLADNSPQAKADLALLIYYAKTAPEDMAVLAARVETDPEKKEAIYNTIKKIVRGNVEATQGLSDLFKEVRRGDVSVGKAKQAILNAGRQLTQAKKQLETSELRVKEMEAASKELTNAIKPLQESSTIHSGLFEPAHGASIILTEGAEPKPGKLSLGPKSSAEVVQILMDNKRWLREHEGSADPLYLAIQDQVDKLGRVAMDQADTKFRDSFWTQRMGSVPERLYALGSSILRQAGDRWQRYFALRQTTEPLTSKGYAVSEAFRKAQKATGFENSYDGFKDTFWNPGFHFLRHIVLQPGTMEENIVSAKNQLKMFFMRSAVTKDIIMRPGAFDAVWDAMSTNAELSKQIAKRAADWKVMVEDDEIKVQNPRTGEFQNALRPAMDVGLFTTQASLHKLFGKIDLLHSVKNENGESLWAQWGARVKWEKEERKAREEGEESYARFLEKDDERPPTVDYQKLFTDEVVHHFVVPYIYDTSTLHFSAPELLDGKTRNKAFPLNVQAAWEAAGSAEGTDVVKFAENLFDLEYTLKGVEGIDEAARKQKFVMDTMEFFQKQYKKIANLTEKQDMMSSKGLSIDRFVATPMMDSISSMDFPHEFLDYAIYDNTTATHMLSQLAAHAALGRDLGMFSSTENGGILWELSHAEQEFRQGPVARYERLSAEFRAENPRASLKEIDNKIAKEVGDNEFEKIKKAKKAIAEIRKIEGETLSYFTSPNGSTREMQTAQQVIGFIAGGLVNTPKSAIYQFAQAFEPFMVWGMGKTGRSMFKRTIEATIRQFSGSFVQAVSKQALLASKYARYMNENNIMRDPHNTITTAQVLADPGKNNVYEDAKLLGWVKKGRSLAFDTGFRGAEGERIAPKFRVFAPFSMMSIAANQGAAEAHIRLVDDALKSGMKAMDESPAARSDPTFQFKKEHIDFADSTFDDLAFDEFKNQFRQMGTTLEIEVRKLLDTRDSGQPIGDIVIPPDLARLVAAEAMRLISLPSDVSTAPIWLVNNPVGRLAMPLITWALNKTNQLVGRSGREPLTGELSKRAMLGLTASLALGMVPAAMMLSLLTDQYDEKVLGKKSSLVGFNFDSPSQTAAALIERVSRVGTFGLIGDLVNGVRVYGTSGDLRGLSVDQRVVFVNELQSLMSLASVAWNQEGTLTYETFYRQLINTLGGGGILQNQQILNNITNSLMGTPIFSAEAETTARLNALNYLRGAGRVTGLDVRVSDGGRALPTPIHPWIREMVVAAYSNNQSEFVEAYRKALATAQEEGKENPKDYVKTAFSSQHPLRSTFRTPPTRSEIANMLGAMSEKGQEDVQSALNNFNAFGLSLGIQPYTGKENIASASKRQPPNPWATK
jgi:hypothetical protein